MIEPGTPAINLPAFAAPTFTDASVPIGGVVTTFSLESTSPVAQTNVPFTFGQPFKAGEMAPTDGLIAAHENLKLPLQFDVKATHNDGSVRHAIISGVWPELGAGEQRDIAITRAVAQSAAGVAATTPAPRAIATIGGLEYVAVTEGGHGAWLLGPIVADRIYDAPLMRDGLPHPDLTVQFCVRHYPGASASKVDITIEHTKAYSLTGDITYDVQIIADNAVRYEKTGLVHYPHTRWKKSFWIGQENPVHVKHNRRYLLDTCAVANYNLSVVMDEATLNKWASLLKTSAFEPMGPGRFQKAMGTGGGRGDIGPAPDSYAATIISGDKRTWDTMLGSANTGGSWSIHRRDRSNGPAAGRPMDIIHWPRSTIMGGRADTMNKLTGQYEDLPEPASASTFKADTSHQPAFAYLPYLLTGDYYYLEELHFWSNFNLFNMSAGYRGYEKGLVHREQVRGQAWSLRTLGEAAYITPDSHPSKAALNYWLKNNLAYANTNYIGDNELGFISDGTYAIIYSGKLGIAPWQDDFYTQAIGRVAELGYTDAVELLRWKARFPIGRMVGEGFGWTDATAYSLRVRSTIDGPLYTTFAEVFANTFPGKSPVPVDGAMDGYPKLTTGYPSNMQPALAMSVDSGIEGGAEAWALFASRSPQPNYGVGPQFAILPRSITSPVPVPVAPPVVVPTPVPTPDPAPTPTPPPEPVEPPPVVEPVPTPPVEPAPALGSLTFSHPDLAGKTGLTILIGDLTNMRVFALPASADASGSLTVHSALIVSHVRYGAVATSATGETLVVLFPVIGG